MRETRGRARGAEDERRGRGRGRRGSAAKLSLPPPSRRGAERSVWLGLRSMGGVGGARQDAAEPFNLALRGRGCRRQEQSELARCGWGGFRRGHRRRLV